MAVLLKTLEEIKPDCLKDTDYSKYINEITQVVKTSLRVDGTHLLLLVNAIKSCKQPCFRRDVMLEVLNEFQKDDIKSLLLNPFQNVNNRAPWKELANTIVTLPDLVANCNALDKFDNFVCDKFYSQLLERLYASLTDCSVQNICKEQRLFFIQLIGRIAFSGYNQLVWQKLTSRVIKEDQGVLKSFLVDILTLPLLLDDQICSQLELFIEPLYIPIFHNLYPSDKSGEYIWSILGDIIYKNETFEYIICNKSILQTNFNRSKKHQEIVLFNIFSYLAYLNSKSLGDSLLIKTLLIIIQSWSNSTKILLRTYEQNRYLSCAFIVALRYCLNHDRDRLTTIANEVQAMIMQAFPTYLNRSSSKQRNLAMCTSEIVFPTIHELIMSQPTRGNELKFDVDWDEDCLDIKQFYCSKLETLFPTNQVEEITTFTVSKPVESSEEPSQRTVEILNLDNNDLSPYDMDDDEDDNDDLAIGEDLTNVPFYLRDCINGLSENNNARYVKLCLIKTGELISQLSEQEHSIEKSIAQTNQTRLKYNESKPPSNDAIRDISIELTQVLLYLDNHFEIESFEAYRLKALSSLSVAAPDLVVKYLLDSFNETNKSIKQLLDILQVLVTSAKELSGCMDDKIRNDKAIKINKFVKYGSLFFYGISHRLEADLNGSRAMLPSVILKAATESNFNGGIHVLSETKSKITTTIQPKGRLRGRMIGERLRQSENNQGIQIDDSYLLSRILFAISLIIKCLYHQPITCKLSNDFVDILAAYRCHPDSGVRKAITNSLMIIRDCTPSVYFEECLKAKTVSLFGSWLAQESELIN